MLVKCVVQSSVSLQFFFLFYYPWERGAKIVHYSYKFVSSFLSVFVISSIDNKKLIPIYTYQTSLPVYNLSSMFTPILSPLQMLFSFCFGSDSTCQNAQVPACYAVFILFKLWYPMLDHLSLSLFILLSLLFPEPDFAPCSGSSLHNRLILEGLSFCKGSTSPLELYS